MIKDLAGAKAAEITAEFLIIGGGTVGLLTSVWLAEAGHKVVCLESGGFHQEEDEHPLNEVVHLKSVYSGAAQGRFRCIGGTSTRWGGALIPFQEADLKTAEWPISMRDLGPFIPEIQAQFDLSGGDYDLPELSSPTHVARLAKWPPFKKRNVFNLVQEKARTLPNLEIWLNATATDFSVQDGLLRRVRARTVSGDELSVSADHVIIAAGAIETTRLALLMDFQNGEIVSRTSPALGRYFSDHLSVPVGEMVTRARAELNRHVGFRFESNGTMRNLRFELGQDADIRAAAPASFAHIAFETDGNGGFDVLRNIFRSLQKRRLPGASDILGLIRTAPWLIRAVWARFYGKRLLFPDGAKLPVHMVIEQEPSQENRISLSKNREDVFGKPLAEITWTVTDSDKANLTRAVDVFQAMWRKLPLSASTEFMRKAEGAAEAEMALGGGIYHPTGSTRMGRTPDEGVVDTDLRMFAIPNVRLLATSVLPTGGGANPTMMLLLLAARYVAQVSK